MKDSIVTALSVNEADLRMASERVSMMHQNTTDKLKKVTDGYKKVTIGILTGETTSGLQP